MKAVRVPNRDGQVAAMALCLAAVLSLAPGAVLARDRPAEDFARIDANGDGNLSREEWLRRGNFERLDANGDGFLSLDEMRGMYRGHDDTSYAWKDAAGAPAGEPDPEALAALIDGATIDKETLCAIGRFKQCDAATAAKHGLFETGLGPVFPEGADCPGVDDYYALDYAFKRSREVVHGGMDMPAKWGTPIIAAAAGTVVGVFEGADTARGREIVLRHSPEDTGLPFWIYTQYAHLDRMPGFRAGQRVKMGDILGPTGNSGVSGKTHKDVSDRRPAIHFAAFYSSSPRYAVERGIVIPENGYWMDPTALYRKAPPIDSTAMKALPDSEKGVPISVMFEDGKTSPADTKLIWPYLCKRM